MYRTADGEVIFVIDGHMHFWDASPGNQKNKFGEGWIDCFYGYRKLFTPPEYVWSLEQYQRYTEQQLMTDLFVDGYVDMAIFLPTYLKEFYINGFNTTEQDAVLKEKYPDRFILNGAFDPRDGDQGLEYLEQLVEKYGIKGVKLYTAEWNFGVQILKALSCARVIALDTRAERLEFARRLGADEAFHSALDGGVEAVRQATAGDGADIVFDFVGEHGTPDTSIKMLKRGGTYSQIGYGGTLTIRTVDLLLGEFTIVGTYNDLAELMELNRQGKVKITAQQFPLENAADVLHELDAGRVEGRAVLLPPGVRQQAEPSAVAGVAAR